MMHYLQKKKIRQQMIALCVAICVLTVAPILVFGAEASNLQSHIEDNDLIVYLPNQDYSNAKGSIQIGNESVNECEILPITEVDTAKVQTVILFDNSLSISEGNREQMKTVVATLVGNKHDDEEFSLITIDTDMHTTVEMTNNTESITAAIKSLSFENQSTYLKDCIYKVLSSNDIFDPGAFKRIIVCADGSDDNPIGYTYDEINSLLQNKAVQIIAIGSKYDKDVEALSHLFSLSRMTKNSYYLLDDYAEDVNPIIAGIDSEKPGSVIVSKLDDSVLDGGKKNVQVRIEKPDEELLYTTVVAMPFSANIGSSDNETEIMTEEPEIIEEEPSAKIEPETEQAVPEVIEQEAEKTNLLPVLLLRMLAVIGAILFALFRRRKKGLLSEEKDREMPADEDEETVLQEEEEETVLQEDGEEETVLMTDENGMDDYSGTIIQNLPKITLTNEKEPGIVHSASVNGEIVIGRKNICDIVLEGDKSVSSQHCIIYSVGPELYIRDNNSSNGTYVNNQKLLDPRKLLSGDVVELGRNRWVITF